MLFSLFFPPILRFLLPSFTSLPSFVFLSYPPSCLPPLIPFSSFLNCPTNLFVLIPFFLYLAVRSRLPRLRSSWIPGQRKVLFTSLSRQQQLFFVLSLPLLAPFFLSFRQFLSYISTSSFTLRSITFFVNVFSFFAFSQFLFFSSPPFPHNNFFTNFNFLFLFSFNSAF